MTSSTVVRKPRTGPQASSPRLRFSPAWRRNPVRIALLGLLCAVLLGLGLVAGNTSDPAPAPSVSDPALALARATARDLALQAEAAAAAAEAAIGAELTAQASGLRVQTSLLAGSGVFPEPAVSGPAASGPAPAADPASYAAALAQSAQANLAAAETADPGTARLLASVGAAQYAWSLRLAATAGTDPAVLPVDPAAEAAAPEEADCSGGPVDTRTQGALTAAAEAEYGTAYAYEVAAARHHAAGSEPPAAWMQAGEAHKRHGNSVLEHQAGLCLPAVMPPPAFTLSDAFQSDPGAALPALEQELTGVYADLVGLSEGNLRRWAAGRLAEAAAAAYPDSASVPASPGVAAQPDRLPWSLGGQ